MNIQSLNIKALVGFDAPTGRAPWWVRVVSNDAFAVFGGLALVVLVPALIDFRGLSLRTSVNLIVPSLLEEAAAFAAGFFLLRRLTSHPGVTNIRYILPILTVTYGTVVARELFTRGIYSGQQTLASYILALIWCYAAYFVRRRCSYRSLAVVPRERGNALVEINGTDWTVLDRPQLPDGRRYDAIVADLHAELGPAWEAFLAKMVLSGIPVYHATQVREALTGRVQIKHLSENVFGSLNPNTIYAKAKYVIDTASALAAFLLLSPLLLVIAAIIRIDTPGPAMFRQKRMGHHGRVFTIFKFRTMYVGNTTGQSFTTVRDSRITWFGTFLRRTHLDELPQILNIIRGEMSWIGPRPMVLDLNGWYQREIPFFTYRHIVRPGITGWAQVQQGYADEIDGATTKLQFDFYYIKNFSFWLDLLISLKTVGTLITGNGAR